MNLTPAISILGILFSAPCFAQENTDYPTKGLGPVETLVQFRIKLAAGDSGALWDVLAPNGRKWLEDNRSDKQFVAKMIEAGITENELKNLSNRDLASLINDKFLRMQDDPTLKLDIKEIFCELRGDNKNVASVSVNFDGGGGRMELKYFEAVDCWLFDRSPFERLPQPHKE